MTDKNEPTVHTDTTLDDYIDIWDDEECLTNFAKFFKRVSAVNDLLQDEDGIITHEVLQFICGDKIVASKPRQLEWPLVPLEFPEDEELKGLVN